MDSTPPAFDSLMLRTFDRLALKHNWSSTEMAESFQKVHDNFLTYVGFSLRIVSVSAFIENLTAEFQSFMEEIGRPDVKLPKEFALAKWSHCEGMTAQNLTTKTKKASRAENPSCSRDDVLEPSVYDLARESARVEGKRLTDRAEIIQRRLEEEQELLRKRRAQMQRRGDSVEKDEQAFAAYQDEAMFRTQILEQRLARHEMQAIEKFQELERMLQEDPRLAAMWQKEPAAVKG
eukprot:Skav221010  [mRNA]  locus=scaffold2350:68436:96326:+ [translate_table: standard]